MSTGGDRDVNPDAGEARVYDRIATIPNAICAIRLVGSLFLVPLAWQQRSEVFLWLFVFLAMTDWIDGKLAILLDQRTVIGARLDSWADAALYAALLFGLVTLHGATLRPELGWLGAMLLTYLLSVAASLWKYRRWPSYHTRTAKISWFLTALGVIALLTEWSVWPLRIAAMAVTVTSLEALVITLVLPRWRVDVPSAYHAWRDRDA